MAEYTESTLVALMGLPGVGKTSLARGLDSLLLDDIDITDSEIHAVPMRQLLSWYGYNGPPSLTGMQEYHAGLREVGEDQQVLDQLRRLNGGIIIVDALRHLRDVEYFTQQLGGSVLYMEADEAVCKERYIADTFDEKHHEVVGPDALESSVSVDAAALRLQSWEQARSEVSVGYELVAWQGMRRAHASIDASGNAQQTLELAVPRLQVFARQRELRNTTVT